MAYSKDLPDTLTPATPLIPATKEVPATATTPMIPAKKAIAAQPEKGKNDQVSAIRDILSMYATVRKDGDGNSAVDGSWGKLKLFSDAGNIAKQNLIRTALFGDGTADKALIARVLTGKNVAKKSEYVNMHAVFDKLGIKSGFDNSDHFHMYLRPPKPMAIGGVSVGNLTLGGDALPVTSTNHPVIASNLQPLIDYSQLLTSLGDEMFIYLDVPYLPLPNLPIITLQDQSDKTKKGNEASSKLEQKFNFIYKECREFEDTMAEDSAERVLIPALSLANYFALKSNYKREFDYRDIKTSILQRPKHGDLIETIDNKGGGAYSYDPEPGYLGKDSAVFVAEFNGKRYKITTELRVVRPHAGESNCPSDRLIKVGQFTPTPNDYKVTFSDLAGSAVGETNGQGLNAQITLDTNAAGHDWFIDETPDNNDEFLPTADPEVWVAKAGTAAAGKMDMLSVLLHEYGHALGIEHSGDNADYMAASLQPGQRRLPSTEELSLMSRLVAALKGGTDDPNDPMNPNLPITSLGLMALCRIRRADYGWTLGVDKAQLVSRIDVKNVLQNASQLVQRQTVVNSTLNQDSSAWQTTGNIGNTDGNITLAESTTSNTHLSQSFAVKQGDRYLSFTVANNHLQNNGVDEDGNEFGPDDAFEVALLNANTGLSVAGTTGLSRSDALLNIQTDGTQSRAASVRKVHNADGSDTYFVDLQQAVNESNGLVTGTPVTLSFDLMGFGTDVASTRSQVSLRDIKLIQDPVAFDDVVTSDEDATATIDVLSNDLLGGGVANSAAQISIVSQPAHGSIQHRGAEEQQRQRKTNGSLFS